MYIYVRLHHHIKWLKKYHRYQNEDLIVDRGSLLSHGGLLTQN